MRSNTSQALNWSIDNTPQENIIQSESVDFSTIDKYKIKSSDSQSKQITSNSDSLIKGKDQIDINSIKAANRAIRAKVKQVEYEKLINMRNDLVDKKFDSGISKKEELQLQMLRWQIEGIEDAVLGPQLDKFELLVENQENLANMINEFNDRVKAAISNKKQ